MSCTILKASFHDSVLRSKRSRLRQNKLEKWRKQCLSEEVSTTKYHERVTVPSEKCAHPSNKNQVYVRENVLGKTPSTSMLSSQQNIFRQSIDRYCCSNEESSNVLNASFSFISKVNNFIHMFDDALLLKEVETIEGKIMSGPSLDGESRNNCRNYSLSKMHREIIQSMNDLRTSQRIISTEKSKHIMNDGRKKNNGSNKDLNSEKREQRYQNVSDVISLANKNWMVDYLDEKEKEIQFLLQKMRRQLFLLDKLSSVHDYHTKENGVLSEPREKTNAVNSSQEIDINEVNHNIEDSNSNLSMENQCESKRADTDRKPTGYVDRLYGALKIGKSYF